MIKIIRKSSRILLVFAVLSLILLAYLELLLRVNMYFTAQFNDGPGISDYIQPFPDSERIYGLKPNLKAPFSTNMLGFRGRDYPEIKPAGTYRIVMLGDSITFGNSVTESQTFSSILERKLNSGGNLLHYEVINLGISGYNTRQELTTLQEVGLSLSPDLVLLNICLNDSDPGKVLSIEGLKNITHITQISDINLRTIVATSYALTYLKKNIMKLIRGNDVLLKIANSPHYLINSRVSEVAWGNMKMDMEKISLLLQKEDIHLGVIVYPYSSQVALRAEERRPQESLREFWRELGFPFLDPIKEFQGADKDMFINDVVHLSPYGHRIMAESISNFLLDHNLLNNNN